ncbi:HAD-IIB family hydrolase [Psittacicella hinzii]|uniref:Uncharacterized protein n=1 Tax=Psittacicella hinzii TaxID=2028575 RepID=A0A3A1YKI3_9GAMM|nr:HAD family hydrolase [Psittacicella hinzii]RIY38773.1 hypothetical protein CKF58_03415 [Psittacicella hinzii]
MQLDFSEIKAIAVDLDGTSLTRQAVLHPFTTQAYNALMQAGYQLIIATGRGADDVPMLRDLNLGYALINYNGGVITIPENLSPPGPTLSPEQINTLYNFSYPEDIWVNFYTAHEWFMKNDFSAEQAYAINTSRCTFLRLAPEQVSSQPVIRAYFVDSARIPGRLNQIAAQLQALLGDGVNIVRSSRYTMEITHQQVHKLAALKTLLASRGLDVTKHLIAFGDSMNDISMLTGAKYGFYLENTLDEARASLEQAPNCYQIGHNANLATARFLNQMFKLGIPEPADLV